MVANPSVVRKVLVVDDEEHIRSMLTRYLGRQGFEAVSASDGIAALDALQCNEDCSLVVTDIDMPRMDGFAMIETAKSQIARPIRYVVVSGGGDGARESKARALGAVAYLGKPLDLPDLRAAVEAASQSLDAIIAGIETADDGPQQDLAAPGAGFTDRFPLFAEALSTAIPAVSQDAADRLHAILANPSVRNGAHCERVGVLCGLLAERAGYPADFCRNIALAACLHDIGKSVGLIDDEDETSVAKHTLLGASVLQGGAMAPAHILAVDIALSHHERFDGSGRPMHLTGLEIPLGARICAICDVYAALRAPASHRSAFTHEEAIDILVHGDSRSSPSQFDPVLLEIFSTHAAEFEAAYNAVD
ncbi:response regulator [Rhodospirillaceae bacterium KN72]|uniref:Response regulator n=1 Tax=Pacificispira spongiicola TaxID=2729598 RepID=A0A7Y0HGL5_9PROT|nr:response regulator [Pacificispira spongiicola]NMM44484.1 response regulator [Pacificispira spongiicola]